MGAGRVRLIQGVLLALACAGAHAHAITANGLGTAAGNAAGP